jgi:quinol-cytochrome oxidoreductase complex cytochrome b subunit
MKKQTIKKERTINLINNSLIDLPTPSNISYLWNIGSIIATTIILQIITGLVVSIHYTTEISHSFESVIKITRNIETGHIIRTIHATGASLFFILIYIHIIRGLFFSAPNKNTKT